MSGNRLRETVELAGIVTDLGASLIEAAYQAGETITIKEMAIGDGGGAPVTVDPTKTALVGEFHRQLLDDGASGDAAFGGRIDYVPVEEDRGKWIREFGLFDDAGNLIVYAKYPDSQIPSNPNMATVFIISIMVPVANASAVEVQLNPEGLVTQQDLHDHTHSVAFDGDIEGSGTIGPDTVTITITVKDDSHRHSTETIDGLEEAMAGKLDVSAYKPRTDALMATEILPGTTDTVDMNEFLPGHIGTYNSDKATHCPSKYYKIGFYTETRAIYQNGNSVTFIQTAQPFDATDNTYAAAYRIGERVGDAAATFSAWIYQYDTANPASYNDVSAAYVSSNFNAYHGKQRIASNGAYPSSEGVWYINNCAWAPEPYGIMAIFINGQSNYAGGHILGHDSAQVAIFLARDTGKFYTGSLPINSGLEAWVWCDSNYPVPPVGSVLFFKDATINPATIYAGTTWARIATNQNIRGAADGEAGGLTGGRDTVALTTNELPPHIHGTEAHSHTGESHVHHIFLKDDLEGGTAGADSRLAANSNSSSSGGSNTYSDYTMVPGSGSTEIGVTSSAAGNTGAAAPNTLSAGSGAAFSVLNSFIKLHIWERTS